MSRLGRRAAGLLMVIGGLVAVGSTDVVAGTVRSATPSTPENPTPTPTPAPQTTAPPLPPTPAPTTTTIPYPVTVKASCDEFPGDAKLADRLETAKGDDGSTHLVILARECGVLFSDEAEVDPDLDRPWSNLEYAVRDQDDPYFTSAYDAVTANPGQAMIVEEASTAEWYRLHPELVPETTAPPTTAAPSTTAAAEVTTTTDNITAATTEPDDRDDSDDDDQAADDEDSTTGSPLWQIVGVLFLGIGAVVIGVSSVRRDPNESQR